MSRKTKLTKEQYVLIGTTITVIGGIIVAYIQNPPAPTPTPPPASGIGDASLQLPTDVPVIPTSTPTLEPTMTLTLIPDPIPEYRWCVYKVPETIQDGEKYLIKDIVIKFLSKEENPEQYKDQVFEATGGEKWQVMWPNALVDESLPGGAEVALDFVKSLDECTGFDKETGAYREGSTENRVDP